MGYIQYNQRNDPLWKYWCTILTRVWICNDQWGLNIQGWVITNMLLKAEALWKWSRIWGWYFSIIDIFFIWWVRINTWITLEAVEYNINSKKFEKDCKILSFWLWIKTANTEYIKAFEDGIITDDELRLIKEYWAWYWHNFRWVYETIIPTLWQKPAKMSLEVLRSWVNIGLFYPTARWLIPKGTFSRFVSKYLRELKKDPKFVYMWESDLQISWFNKALELKRKYG